MSNGDEYENSAHIRTRVLWSWDQDDDDPQWADLSEVESMSGDVKREVGPRVIALPHQCDAWVIGGTDRVQALIGDLLRLLPQLEDSPRG